MSPLGRLILTAMRAGSISAAIFVVLVIAIELWKHWTFGGFETMRTPDIAFMGVLLVMLAGFVWLARAITREMKKHHPTP
jgi:uncharacterized protein with PQ loop repeat